MVGYIRAATALLLHFDRDPHNQATLEDALPIPVRWRCNLESRGRSLIEDGGSEAIVLLREILKKMPDFAGAARQLAE